MEKLRDRLALLLKEFRSWDPKKPSPKTANQLAREYNLDLETILRLGKSEGFHLRVQEGVPKLAPEQTTDRIGGPALQNDELPLGTKIGRYELLEKLGEGGMGIVYIAHDPQLRRNIAIKVLRLNVSEWSDEDTHAHRQRLMREAQAMAQLSHHANIVPIYDVGTFANRVFIAMEYIEGLPINTHISHHKLSWWEARELYMQAALGLMEAHKSGLVHRDFKPDNVLVDASGRVKVMDFGLARLEGSTMRAISAAKNTAAPSTEKSPLNTTLTATGHIMGTPAYMSPEQFLLQNIDARADQFSFCVSMYEALAGFRPYQADSFTTLARKVLSRAIVHPPLNSEVPDWIWDALMKGLETKPEDRWASMSDLLEALREPPPHVKAQRRQKLMRMLGLVGGFGIGAGAVGFILAFSQPDPDPEPLSDSMPRGISVNPQGTLSPEDVHREILRNKDRHMRCYAGAARRNPDLTGMVEVHFTIHPNGFVEKATALKSTFEDERVGECVAATTLHWDFKDKGLMTRVDVVYPFVFSPPKEE